MVYDFLIDTIRKTVTDIYKVCPTTFVLEHPSDEKWGDFATNVALLVSKDIKQSPMIIADEIIYRLRGEIGVEAKISNGYEIFQSINVAPPGFINFKLSKIWLQNYLFNIAEQNDSYGSSDIGKNKTILIEFSQPNPNKTLHIGHARNNFLGSSLSNIYKFVGYKVIRANYMNDWGVHICKSMLMYSKFGEGKDPDKKSDHFVGDYYSMFEKEAANDPNLEEEARELFRKLENGDANTLELWKKITSWAYEGWKKTYEDEKVTFDIWQYQSHYKEIGKDIANLAVKRGIAQVDETGAIVARLKKYDLPDKVLLRSDGTSVYSTQDLQLAKDSFEKFNLDQRLYVVDFRQNDYFKQVFRILEILGFPWAKNLHHVSYGVVKLPSGQMSSRKGLVINADDVFAELVVREEEEVKARSEAVSDSALVVRQVALAAFKYPLLKIDPKQDIVFDYSYVTRFDGDTGPYLQYTYARCCSVLRKSGIQIKDIEEGIKESIKSQKVDSSDSELKVLRALVRFPEVVSQSAESFSPSLICYYLFDLAQRFNSFYNEVSILSAQTDNDKNFRLLLTKEVSQVLKNGLALLGIESPQRM